MQSRRGRPTGHKLSDVTKMKISNSKMGQTHTEETKNKISESVTEYYKTEKGMAQRQLYGEINSEFWGSYSGRLARNIISNGMRKYWRKYKKSIGE